MNLSVEWIFLKWILNGVLNWIIFGPDSTFDWIIKTYQTGLSESQEGKGTATEKGDEKPEKCVYGE